MSGLDDITSKAFMATWVGLPSLFWLRGIWRDKSSDRWAASILFMLFAFVAVSIDHTTWPLNTAGGFVVILGVVTMVAGPLGKKMTLGRALDYGVVCIIVGILMGMLI